MGQIKRLIEDLTYTIMEDCEVEDTGENFDRVFLWVMDHNYGMPYNDLVELYKKEQELEHDNRNNENQQEVTV